MSEKFRWGSSDEESGAESSWSGTISLNSFFKEKLQFQQRHGNYKNGTNEDDVSGVKGTKSTFGVWNRGG